MQSRKWPEAGIAGALDPIFQMKEHPSLPVCEENADATVIRSLLAARRVLTSPTRFHDNLRRQPFEDAKSRKLTENWPRNL